MGSILNLLIPNISNGVISETETERVIQQKDPEENLNILRKMIKGKRIPRTEGEMYGGDQKSFEKLKSRLISFDEIKSENFEKDANRPNTTDISNLQCRSENLYQIADPGMKCRKVVCSSCTKLRRVESEFSLILSKGDNEREPNQSLSPITGGEQRINYGDYIVPLTLSLSYTSSKATRKNWPEVMEPKRTRMKIPIIRLSKNDLEVTESCVTLVDGGSEYASPMGSENGSNDTIEFPMGTCHVKIAYIFLYFKSMQTL